MKVWVRIGVAVTLLLSPFGCSTHQQVAKPPAPQHQQVVQPTACSGGEHDIGHLKWVITERATRKVLGSGERQIQLTDVTISYSSDSIHKQISLSDGFIFQMVDPTDHSKSAKTGFAMVVRRFDLPTFSWEWFLVDSDSHATKLQESGELAIILSQIGSGWEVTCTEFLSDVSFRVFQIFSGSHSTNPIRNPIWKVTIYKGSHVTWPSIVDGKVIAN